MEEVREYSVMIDSKDRNYQNYPDPFNYIVRFSPLPRVDGHEDPMPVIYDIFTNVRYIKLETIILPIYYRIKQVKEWDPVEEDYQWTWKVDTDQKLTDLLYVTLSIGEHTDINYRSTNDVLANSFAVIYYENNINETHYMGRTNNGEKIFPWDCLAKITQFRISFMDPYGNQLTCPHVDKNIRSEMVCHCNDEQEDELCFRHNLRHPLNPLFQHHLQFKIGVLEKRPLRGQK